MIPRLGAAASPGTAGVGLPRVRFPCPPAEPDMRVATHPALHVSCPLLNRCWRWASRGRQGCSHRGSGSGSWRPWRCQRTRSRCGRSASPGTEAASELDTARSALNRALNPGVRPPRTPSSPRTGTHQSALPLSRPVPARRTASRSSPRRPGGPRLLVEVRSDGGRLAPAPPRRPASPTPHRDRSKQQLATSASAPSNGCGR